MSALSGGVGLTAALRSGLSNFARTGSGKTAPPSAAGPKGGAQTPKGSYKGAPDTASKGRYNATRDDGIRINTGTTTKPEDDPNAI